MYEWVGTDTSLIRVTKDGTLIPVTDPWWDIAVVYSSSAVIKPEKEGKMSICFYCAKYKESVQYIDKLNKSICSQCFKAGLYKQDYHLKEGPYNKGYVLFRKKEHIKFYPSRRLAEEALFKEV